MLTIIGGISRLPRWLIWSVPARVVFVLTNWNLDTAKTSHTNQAWHAHPTIRFASAKMFAVILMFIVEKYHLNSAVSSSHATGQPLLENLQTTKIFTQSLYRIFTNKNKTTTEKNLLYRKKRNSSKAGCGLCQWHFIHIIFVDGL